MCLQDTMYTFMITLFVLLTSSVPSDGQVISPPSNLGRPYENFTEKTMDEIIMETMGGVDEASNMILADDRHILAELDMYLTLEQFLSLYKPPEMLEQSYNYLPEFTEDYKGSGIRTKRKAVRDIKLRWTDAEMPYLFAKGHFTEQEEYMMRRSMTEWERYTCIKFRPATSGDRNSVRFQNGVGCNSQLGMVRGVQVINLQAPGCRFKGLYLHEIGHAIGLVHEHQLPNRDKYITILYENVAPHMRIWFDKYKPDQVNQSNVAYEYSSVMHYGITAFAHDGKSQTIRALDSSKEKEIGEVYLKELAYTDVQMVNLMYGCSSHCTNQDQCGSDGHLDQNCNCICKDGSSDCDRSKTTDVTCNNKYDSWSCYIWANQGECERNPYYMKQQCSKACGVCGHETNAKGECKNVYNDKKCKMWRDRGDCITNERWMESNCRLTCNLCGNKANRPEINCQNSYVDSTKCDDWAKNGECSVNAAWMSANCRKSCQMCAEKEVVDPGDEDRVDEDDMKCEDKNPECQNYFRAGHCEGSPGYMIPNCRKACGKCDDGTCKNLYDDVQCQIWAEKLECLLNTDWMGKHCAKACGRGICEGVDPTAKISTTLSSLTTETTICKNLHSSDKQCDIWATNDHCNINPSWMMKNCAKSCQACSGDGGSGGLTTTVSTKTTNSVTGSVDCQDKEVECASWTKHGFCDSNPRYNLIFCKKSCNNCNGCLDTNFLCKVWADNGQCEMNAGYMLRHCQKSCNTCFMSRDDLHDLRPGNGSNILMTSIQLLMISLVHFIVFMFVQ